MSKLKPALADAGSSRSRPTADRNPKTSSSTQSRSGTAAGAPAQQTSRSSSTTRQGNHVYDAAGKSPARDNASEPPAAGGAARSAPLTRQSDGATYWPHRLSP